MVQSASVSTSHPPFEFAAMATPEEVRTVADCLEVSAVDPVVSISAIENPDLTKVAGEVRDFLTEAIEAI